MSLQEAVMLANLLAKYVSMLMMIASFAILAL
jgi:hypothetical protein